MTTEVGSRGAVRPARCPRKCRRRSLCPCARFRNCFPARCGEVSLTFDGLVARAVEGTVPPVTVDDAGVVALSGECNGCGCGMYRFTLRQPPPAASQTEDLTVDFAAPYRPCCDDGIRPGRRPPRVEEWPMRFMAKDSSGMNFIIRRTFRESYGPRRGTILRATASFAVVARSVSNGRLFPASDPS